MRFDRNVTIEAPLEQVFEILVDNFAKFPDQNGDKDAKTECLTPGPVGVGTRFRILSNETEQFVEIVEYKVNQKALFVGSSYEIGSNKLQYTVAFGFTFKSLNDTTRVKGSVKVSPASWRGKLMEIVIKVILRLAKKDIAAETNQQLKSAVDEAISKSNNLANDHL